MNFVGIPLSLDRFMRDRIHSWSLTVRPWKTGGLCFKLWGVYLDYIWICMICCAVLWNWLELLRRILEKCVELSRCWFRGLWNCWLMHPVGPVKVPKFIRLSATRFDTSKGWWLSRLDCITRSTHQSVFLAMKSHEFTNSGTKTSSPWANTFKGSLARYCWRPCWSSPAIGACLWILISFPLIWHIPDSTQNKTRLKLVES